MDLTGKLLAAMPGMGDARFERALVLVCSHSNEGAMGLIVNRNLADLSFPTLLKQLGISNDSAPIIDVHYGGPVEQDNLFFIHQLGALIADSIQINENLFWSGDFDQVMELVNAGRISFDQIRFFLGYSGWGEGQLEAELKEEAWILKDTIDPEEWMRTSNEEFWKNQMVALGGKYLIWSNAPENPMSN